MDNIFYLSQLCLISAVITYSLGLFVLARNTSVTVNRLFCAVMFSATYWAIGEYMIWQAGNYQEAQFWLKASSFWTIVIILTIHFIITYTQHPLSNRGNIRVLILVLYLPAIFFSLIEILTDEIFIIKYQPSIGYYYAPVLDSPVYLAVTCFFIIIVTWGTLTACLSWHRSDNKKIKKQHLFLTIGFFCVLVLGSQSVLVLPSLEIHVPNLVFIGIVIFSVIIYYAIIKYDLFTISPETAAINIIKTMPDGLILTDMDGIILTINAQGAAIFQKEIKEVTGKQVDQYLPGMTYSIIIQRLHESESLSDMEVPLQGTCPMVISISGSLIKDPDGDPAGIILIMRNITSRKEAEQALEVANKKISLLTRLTRHDINNLVTPLYGYLSLLNEEEENTSHNPNILICLNLVEKIVQQLQFSQTYHEIGMQKPEWISLTRLISGTLADFSPDNVMIKSSVCNAEVYADPLIRKVIYNLLENSIRHGEDLSCISIISEIQGDGDLIVKIQDNGIGIKDEEKELIFLYGYGKNTGLGLSLSREILSITGITITETGTYGSGACFTLQIPGQIYKINA